MELREAFLASKLFGNGGGGGGGNTLDEYTQTDWDGHIVLNTATTIRSSAFASQSSLVEAAGQQVSEIYGSAFRSCAGLEGVSFPECTLIGAYAFAYCSNLVDLFVPKINQISAYAFAYCRNLPAVSFAEAELIEGMSVFTSCASLSLAILPKVHGNLGGGAFMSCSGLETVILGNMTSSSLTFSNANAFQSCTKLKSLYLLYTSVVSMGYSQYGIDPFKYTPIVNSSYIGEFGSIYIPFSLLSLYQARQYWSAYSARFVGLTDEEIAALPI